MQWFLRALLATTLLLPRPAQAEPSPTALLNVSYDVTRPFYRELNPVFSREWKAKTGQEVTLTMSHDGSTKQARAVLDGLDADVVTMNQDTDIDLLAQRGSGLVAPDWRKRFPNSSVPYTSTILFLVRKDNPKGIHDWDDLTKPGLKLIVPNPKTSGNGRYSYLGAWAYALRKNNGDEAKAREFVKALFTNAAVLDTGGRAATTTFAQRGIGDVLLTFENEALSIQGDPSIGGGKFQVVVPSMSIRADPPVALVEKNVDAHATRAVAQAYLQFLFTPPAQELAAKNNYRPIDKEVLARHADVFKTVDMVDVETVFGGWARAQETHFKDGGTFDAIYHP